MHGSLHGVLIDGGKNVCARNSFYDVCRDAFGHGIDKGVKSFVILVNSYSRVPQGTHAKMTSAGRGRGLPKF